MSGGMKSGGLEAIKTALQECIAWPMSQPQLFQHVGLRPPHGILLYGPPGNGKTLVVKALASQSNLNFISIKGPELLSKYVGESERGVRELFARARQAAPCIVFLDEVDALVPRRGLHNDSPVTDRVVSQLLTEIDGIEALKDVWVIAATNRPDMLDDALLRPGRLDYRLEVPKPDRPAREAIVAVHLRGKPVAEGVQLADLADQTDGMSAAEIRFICDSAAMSALRRVFPSSAMAVVDSAAVSIGQSDFDDALQSGRGSARGSARCRCPDKGVQRPEIGQRESASRQSIPAAAPCSIPIRAQPIRPSQQHARHDQSQQDQDFPKHIGFVNRSDVHVGLEQFDCGDSDDRRQNLELEPPGRRGDSGRRRLLLVALGAGG
jgi:SpoVK/Ycf46/Vps4 family AAA+-type ATPase